MVADTEDAIYMAADTEDAIYKLKDSLEFIWKCKNIFKRKKWSVYQTSIYCSKRPIELKEFDIEWFAFISTSMGSN